MHELQEADVRILSALQLDGGLSIAALSEKVNLSHNSVWRRIKTLESDGVIQRRAVILSAEKIGLNLTVFVSIKASEHSEEWLERFAAVVRDLPEIVELYRMTGDVDYLMKVRVSSISDYDVVYKKLIAGAKLVDVSSAFVMEEMKHTTALPLKAKPRAALPPSPACPPR